MNKKARAIIEWIPAKEGGRRQPWHGKHYATVARFLSPSGETEAREWSIVFEPSKSRKAKMLGHIRFLAQEAPSSLLNNGAKFELLEGNRRVARGHVCRPSITDIARRKMSGGHFQKLEPVESASSTSTLLTARS